MPIAQGGNYQPSNPVSPGVYTREIDQSFLAQGVAQIGGVIVAPFPKGPGFTPTTVTSEADLTNIFGDPDGVLYGPYSAQQYIRQQGQVTVVRVGGLGGYDQKHALLITALPGEYGRFPVSSSFTGKTVGTRIVGSSGSYAIEGTLSVTFTSGDYSGSTMVVGGISASVLNAYDPTGTLISGSIDTNLIASSLPHKPSNPIRVSSSLNVVQVSPCKSEAIFSGLITGLYGDFDPSTWVAGQISSEDDCGGITGSVSRDEVVLATLANTAYDRGQNLNGFSGSVLLPKNLAVVGPDFRLTLNDVHFDVNTGNYVSSSYGTYEFSTDAESSAYITNVWGTDPTVGFTPIANGQRPEVAYLSTIFDNRISEIFTDVSISGSWKISISARDAMTFSDGITPDIGTSTYDLRQAETPWIRSQAVAPWSGSGSTGSFHYDLFKVHTMSDGTNMNTEYKIEISNVKSAGSISGTDWGSFSLSVRSFTDTDKKPLILEKFDNLTLNPDDANFVGRRIGDMYRYIDFNGKILEFGDYKNISRLIRIETAISPWPKTVIPFGFGPYAAPIGGDYARLGKLPAMQYSRASIYSTQPGRYTSGILFDPAPSSADEELSSLYPNGSSIGPERDNKQYFKAIPLGSSAAANVGFDLDDTCGITSAYVPTEETINVKKRRFILGFQGGFDGQSPSIPILVGNDILLTNQQGLDCSTNKTNGSIAYKQCIAALSNGDEWDFNLITTPGINHQYHPYVVGLTVEMCENRGDAFYIFDIAPNQLAGGSSIDNVIEMATQFDTSYAATYYPWIKIVDTNSNKIISVPPSVVMPAVYAANDRVAAEWFAPAGLNRGGIPAAVQVVDRLTHGDRDSLYEGKVNPIAAFPGQGVVAWGQKTLQRQPSALDRINVRRLMIALKKFIAGSSRFLLFEQNTSATQNRFLSIVNPYLESVQQRYGLYAFRVVMDSTNNTPDLVDRNILYGQIYLQPAKTVETLLIDFNLTPTGATFTSG